MSRVDDDRRGLDVQLLRRLWGGGDEGGVGHDDRMIPLVQLCSFGVSLTDGQEWNL